MESSTYIGKPNCSPVIARPGKDERCPECRMWHLRPGFCPALDPVTAPMLARIQGRKIETPTPDETVASVSPAPSVSPSVSPEGGACEQCGKPKEGKGRFCSPACRLKSHRSKTRIEG
jgi:hypothetical protein